MPVSVWTSTLRRTIQTAESVPFPKLRWKVCTSSVWLGEALYYLLSCSLLNSEPVGKRRMLTSTESAFCTRP